MVPLDDTPGTRRLPAGMASEDRLYVSDTASLATLVETLRASDAVALDTEFMREKTYFAKLCLIQIATPEVCAVIDPLVIDDLSPLAALMADQNVVKVFHAGGQDLEILHQMLGVATGPVFDTQVAATLLGYPQQVGYGALVSDMLGVQLDKGDSFTDWSRRPLTATQVEYARNDVIYLVKVYEAMRATLEELGRIGWLQGDFTRMADPSTYVVKPEEMWRKVKRASTLKRRQLAVLREVAAWRELEAQRKDIPRKWVLSDESLIEVARRTPQTAEALRDIRGVGERVPGRVASSLIAAVNRGLEAPEDTWPRFEKRHRPLCDVDGAVDLMAALVRVRAREHGVAAPLLAPRTELERLAAGDREGVDVLDGWRRQLVGDELIDLLDGNLSMHLSDCVIEVTKRVRSPR